MQKKILILGIIVALTSCGKKTNKPTNSSSNQESTSTSLVSSSSSIESTVSSTQYVDEDVYDTYYESLVSWTNGEDLKAKIQSIIKENFTMIPYASNWTTNQLADQSQTNYDYVEQVYSNNEILKTSTYSSSNTSGWQREHAYCQSLMGHYVTNKSPYVQVYDSPELTSQYKVSNITVENNLFKVIYDNNNTTYVNSLLVNSNGTNTTLLPSSYTSSNVFSIDENNNLLVDNESLGLLTRTNYSYKGEGNGGVASDFHNLFASFYSGNTSRGNKNLGVATNPNTIGDAYQSDPKVFEPSSKDKGMLARALLYMDTMYDDLSLREEYVTIDDVLTSGKGMHGNLSTIVSWAKDYTVDYHEYQHNIEVYKQQHNRNPFVDFPSLVDYIYGDKKNESGMLSDLAKTRTENALKTKVHIYKNLAVEGVKYTYYVGESYSINDIKHIYTKYTNLSSEEILDKSGITSNINEGYEFTSADIGTKNVTISDSKTSVNYTIDVKAEESINQCNYRFSFMKSDGSANTALINNLTAENPITIDMSGVSFDYAMGFGKKGSGNKDKGVCFGAANTNSDGTNGPCKTLDIVSKVPFEYDSKSLIEKVFIDTCLSTGKQAKLTIKIGDEVIDTITINNSTSSTFEFTPTAAMSGQLSICFSDVTGGLYIKEIGVLVK